jgi:hypothetical protein
VLLLLLLLLLLVVLLQAMSATGARAMLMKCKEAQTVVRVTSSQQMAKRPPCPLYNNERGIWYKCIYLGVWGAQTYMRLHSNGM